MLEDLFCEVYNYNSEPKEFIILQHWYDRNETSRKTG